MKHLCVAFLIVLVACTSKPRFYGVNKTDNFVIQIDRTDSFITEPGWGDVLKREPIISGKGKITLQDLENVQIECNQFNWAHKDERWSTTTEAKLKGWGDCKDAAMCKYRKLRALGAKINQLNLWSGWFGGGYKGHVTLAVHLEEKQYILDNMNNNVILAKDYMHKYFEPYVRFNEVGWDIN
jgi:hypothetical protein